MDQEKDIELVNFSALNIVEYRNAVKVTLVFYHAW